MADRKNKIKTKKIKTPNKKQKFSFSNVIDEPFDLYNHLPYQLAVVTNLLQLNKDASIRTISQLEPREFRVLINIGSFMPIKAADIAYLGRLDAYTVSRAVKKLIQENYVVVETSEKNRKIKNLILTEKGIELYYQLRDMINKRTEKLESVLTQSERTQLMQSLQKIEAKAESLLAKNAMAKQNQGETLPADQKEIIRWYKKSCKTEQ